MVTGSIIGFTHRGQKSSGGKGKLPSAMMRFKKKDSQNLLKFNQEKITNNVVQA